jgi:hypothetical protein
MADSLRTKMVYACIDMQKYLLNWNFGKRMTFTTAKGEVKLPDMLFDLLDEEDLWKVFNQLKQTSSQPMA